ncbi:Lrp/AsnC family transcriptional regulator [Paracoccaceae bacterium]|nr:Lrp/AsnC family transcriptional regulator [Paracoccaceae bacterium]
MTIDDYDISLMRVLQHDSTLTNAQLSELVHLSASQCSRRRSMLEKANIILAYGAQLNAKALGFNLKAFTRVNLQQHGPKKGEAFEAFVAASTEIRNAYSVSGGADYMLEIHVADLETFSQFMHKQLLRQPQVGHVRSEIVLKPLKDQRLLPI